MLKIYLAISQRLAILTVMKTNLPAYKVIYEDGSSYVTSMAKGITLADARAYFVGKSFEQDDEKTMKRIRSVEHSDKPTCLSVKPKLTDGDRIDLTNAYRDQINRFGFDAWKRHAKRLVRATHLRLGENYPLSGKWRPV